MHMRPLPSVPLPRANPMKRFFWWCSGADITILRTWACSTEHNTYAGIGATIFLTAVLASLSGGYALWTVFQSSPYAITFGLLWGILIFNLDRSIPTLSTPTREKFDKADRPLPQTSEGF